MDKEKVRELARYIEFKHNLTIENAITEWLEQNQPEPVVVGLSDSQVDCLADYYFGLMRGDKQSRSTIKNAITKWLKNQTFAHPEVKEVVVGLSDEQILSFMAKYGTHPVVGMNLKEWLKTQTLIHPDDELRSYVEELRNEIITLKSNLQPNWDDAPVSTIGAALFLDFYDETAKTVKSVVIKRFERPHPPAPKVEVGQVWRYKGNAYVVESVGKLKRSTVSFGDGWIDCVSYSNETVSDTKPVTYYTRTLSDFLAKFVRVE